MKSSRCNTIATNESESSLVTGEAVLLYLFAKSIENEHLTFIFAPINLMFHLFIILGI